MNRFNFEPFSGMEPTHRIEYYDSKEYGCLSCPAYYATDEEAIEAAKEEYPLFKDAFCIIVVSRYENINSKDVKLVEIYKERVKQLKH